MGEKKSRKGEKKDWTKHRLKKCQKLLTTLPVLTPPGQQKVLLGWAAIGRVFNWSFMTMLKRREELSVGNFIFYLKIGGRRRVCSTKGLLMRWAAEKGQRGERL